MLTNDHVQNLIESEEEKVVITKERENYHHYGQLFSCNYAIMCHTQRKEEKNKNKTKTQQRKG